MYKAYITQDIIVAIVKFINIEGKRKMKEKKKQESHWIMTDEKEIWSLVGILLTCGHMKQGMADV